MQAVYSLFEGGAHLHLVDEQVVLPVGCIAFLDVCFHGAILHDALEVGQVVVDVDDAGIWLSFDNLLRQGLHELGFARSADAGNDLDVGRVGKLQHLREICCALYKFHARPPRLE